MQTNTGRQSMKEALIGLLAGIPFGVFVLLWIALYSVIRPDMHQSSTSALAIFGCIPLSIYGAIAGAVAGAIAGACGYEIRNASRGAFFGLILMGLLGIPELISGFAVNPERVSANLGLLVGMTIVSSCLSGAVAGAVVGALSKHPAQGPMK